MVNVHVVTPEGEARCAAWHEGYKAYASLFGKKNPYQGRTPEHAAWLAGFNEAVGERAW